MPVHSLELENFKSYGGLQRIGPFTNFSCVIGPNGSGKSNLMDSISFVLGVQSKALRSQQLQDLIYREPGSENQKRKRFGASVTLLYRVTREEEDHSITVSDLHDDASSLPSRRRPRKSAVTTPSTTGSHSGGDDGKEAEGRMMRFGRSISPSGVGEYHLDGQRVTWTAYEKALSKLGVLVKARNFLVFQGDVEALARKTPTQLVQLVDVLSGSAAYQKEYDAALAEQQERQQATVLQWQTQKGLRQERRLLKQQKLEAEKFEKLQQERRELQTEFYLWQLYHVQQEIEKRQDDLKAAQDHVEALQEEQDQGLEKVQAVKKDLSAIRRQLAQRQEEDLTRITSILDAKEPALEAVKADQADLSKKLQSDESALSKARKKTDSHQHDLQALVEELEKAKSDLAVLEEEYERVKEEATRVKWTAAQEEEYEQVKRQAKAASALHVTKLQQENHKMTFLKTKAANIEKDLEDLQSQLKNVDGQSTAFRDRRDKLGKTLEQTKEELAKSETELVELQKRHRASAHRKQELDLALEEVQAQLRDAKAVLHRNKDEERLSKTVKNLKTFTSTGVYGRLADLCRPVHKQFNMAVTVAAGKDMDAIVVDTPQTAQTCIQYLREQRIGTATFLPLSQLQVPSHESIQHLRAMVEPDARFRLAVDVITVSDEHPNVDLQKAVQYAVGNTVVCDDLQGARDLCYRRNQRIKAVTLQGAVISKAGTMTGGNARDDKSKNLWKNVEVEKLQAKYDELAEERSKLDQETGQPQQDLQDLQNNLGALKNKAKFIKTDLDYTESQYKEKIAMTKNIEKQIQKLQKDQKAADEAVQQIEQAVEAARQAVVAAEEEHLQPFRERTGLTDLKAYDQAMGKSREEFQENKRVLVEHMAALQQKKEHEEARDVLKPITRIEQRIAERKEAVKTAHEKQKTLEKEIDEAKKEMEKAQEAVSKLEAEEKEIIAKVKESQKELDTAKNASKKAAHAVTQQESALERLRGKLHETLQKARVEEVELPMRNPEDEDSDAEGEGEESKGKPKTRQQRRSKSSRNREEDEDSSDPTSSQISSNETQPFTQETQSRAHFSQAENAVVVRDRQKASMVDYSGLSKALKQGHSEKEERKTRKEFDDKLAKITADIEAMTPNMKAAEALDACTEKLKESSSDYENAKSEAARASQEFERIKAKRTQLFSEAFEQIDDSLKTIYTDMTKSSKHPLGGNAYLSLDDTEEPYNGGLKFNAMPPMKRFRDMEHLSGGEKTVAALSLLFAIHSFRPAPFFIMDEIDAALDNINLRKVCNYIRQRSQTDFQCIVISLKDMFYEQADALVGICRDAGTNSSRTLTLDLTRFDRNTLNTTIGSVSTGKRRSSSNSVASSSAASKRTRRNVSNKSEKNVIEGEGESNEEDESAIISKRSRHSSVVESDEEESAVAPKKSRRSMVDPDEEGSDVAPKKSRRSGVIDSDEEGSDVAPKKSRRSGVIGSDEEGSDVAPKKSRRSGVIDSDEEGSDVAPKKSRRSGVIDSDEEDESVIVSKRSRRSMATGEPSFEEDD